MRQHGERAIGGRAARAERHGDEARTGGGQHANGLVESRQLRQRARRVDLERERYPRRGLAAGRAAPTRVCGPSSLGAFSRRGRAAGVPRPRCPTVEPRRCPSPACDGTCPADVGCRTRVAWQPWSMCTWDPGPRSPPRGLLRVFSRIDGAALVGDECGGRSRSDGRPHGRCPARCRPDGALVRRRRGTPDPASTSTAAVVGGRRCRSAVLRRTPRPAGVGAEPGSDPSPLTDDADVRYGGLRATGGMLLGIRERAAASGRSCASTSTVRERATSSRSDFVAQPAHSRRAATGSRGWPGITPTCRGTARDAAYRSPRGRRRGRVDRRDRRQHGALQPEWTDEDDLLYLDDATGRWNLWSRAWMPTCRGRLRPADADTGGPAVVARQPLVRCDVRRRGDRCPHQRLGRARLAAPPRAPRP
jgi:hypothetical protein